MSEERPKRIQRKRTKGYRLPPNAVYVGRPTRWGNGFPESLFGREPALFMFGDSMRAMKSLDRDEYEALLAPLKGKDLACWCRLDQACHADILLELANAE